MKQKIKIIGKILLIYSGAASTLLIVAAIINYNEGGMYYGLVLGPYIIFPAMIGLACKLYVDVSAKDDNEL